MKNYLLLAKWLMDKIRPFASKFLFISFSGIILALCGVGIAIASKALIDAASQGKTSAQITSAIVLLFLIIIQISLQACVSIASDKISILFANSMRNKLISRLYQSEWLLITKYHSGDILTRVSSDIDIITAGISNVLPSILSLSVRIVAAFSVLFYFEPVLALLAFILGPVSILLSRIWGHKLKNLHLKIQEAESSSRSVIHESIQNIQIIKAFSLETYSLKRINNMLHHKQDWIFLRGRIEAAAGLVLSSGYWLGFFLAFSWGAFNLSKGSAGFGTLAAFIQLIEQIHSPFIGLAQTLPQLISVAGSAERLMELENLRQESLNYDIKTLKNAGIEFENICFSYDDNQYIFENMSFKVNPGEILGIIGTSGEGKTTLIRLLLSFISATKGHVYFTDGQGGKFNACSGTRSLVSFIPQGNTLFSGTIAENLLIGCQNATIDELKAAAQAANAWEFIEKLPAGLHTVIGERGLGLSAGQAQRLAIARAFLHMAPILILDEATSDLDLETEISILRNIQNLRPRRTCIIITHRTAALEICNRVLKLEDGILSEYDRK